MKKELIYIVIGLCFISVGCNRSSNTEEVHRLSIASSPYLREHADNPVDWYEWGEEALRKAKSENKPLLISIGFSSCHWCHVMERESFMDTAVARVMNENFIPVKVDREQRPDIDQIYIHAAQLISGSAGWPLNAFALPDGRPFFAGTYLPKEDWLSLLHQVIDTYQNDRSAITRQAEALTKGIRTGEFISSERDSTQKVTRATYVRTVDDWRSQLDDTFGGQRGAPKFPMPVIWESVLQAHVLNGDAPSLKIVTTTLDRMAAGGIYDHLGGGFSRYTTDEAWKVPHFEKMLYDNAQLVSLYAHVFQVTGDSFYQEILVETLGFIDREMKDTTGGFYSSLNADSEGEEGRYYTWTREEIEKILGPNTAALFCKYYGVTESGNWEHGRNILYRDATTPGSVVMDGEGHEQLDDAKSKLFEARRARPAPSTDTKMITSWNALMLIGYLDAYSATSDSSYLQSALVNATFLRNKMIRKEGGLWRNYSSGTAEIDGFLDDYANLSLAFIKLYQRTFDIRWLQEARALSEFAIQHFRDPQTGLFFYTSDLSEQLVVRKKEIADEVMPSSNSVMSEVLLLLGEYYQDSTYSLLATTMLDQVSALQSGVSGIYYANWNRVSGWAAWRPFEVAILGDQALKKCREMQKHYNPLALYSGGQKENLPLLDNKLVEGRTIIYVCRNNVCKLPVEDVDDALSQLVVNKLR